ncbi:MAG: phytanoyl-CoA dioxygenase family protein [Pseudomonadales bacterium]|nr:phytanoyl-CoA dioxygenase family protein [Pseudomonadales bacterium]
MVTKLSADEVSRYQQDGVVAPVSVMSPAVANELRCRLESAEKCFPQQIGPEKRNNAHYVLACLDEIVHHDEILDAVECLIGPDIILTNTVLFIKEPNSLHHVTYHQDATYMGLEPQDSLTAWIALTESTRENGCVRMIQGSHLLDIQQHIDTFGEDNILTRGQQIENIDEERALDIELEPGQMSLHHARTIHGSRPNKSANRRIGIALQSFARPSTRQVHGEDYALLVRGSDDYGNFTKGPRPKAEVDLANVEFRDGVNARLSEILYAGAEKQRGY